MISNSPMTTLSDASTSSAIWMSATQVYSSIVQSPGTFSIYTSSSYNPTTLHYTIERCRDCHHGHSALKGPGCFDVDSHNSLIYSVVCPCKERVPLDNLEYLEYLSAKKESL